MGPSAQHEFRVASLDAIARLSGYSESLPLPCPGLGIPDVARFSARTLGIFIGDGKATESPGNSATVKRLTKYSDFLVRWHDQTGAGVILMLGFTRPSDALGWWDTAHRLPLFQARAKVVLHALDHDERIIALAVRRAEGARLVPARFLADLAAAGAQRT